MGGTVSRVGETQKGKTLDLVNSFLQATQSFHQIGGAKSGSGVGLETRGCSFSLKNLILHLCCCFNTYLLYYLFMFKINFSWSIVALQCYTSFFVVQSLSHVQLFATPWTAACQASLSFIISWSLFKLMSIELVMPSNHLFFCHPLLLLPSIFRSIRVFYN